MTPGERLEWAKCAVSAAYFCDAYGVIDDAQGHGGETGTMPFKLWPAQLPLMDDLCRERLVVILKARQLGISWVLCVFILWKCLFFPGQEVLLFSKGQKEANELIRRVRALYDRLPRWLQVALPGPILPGSRTAVEWVNGSRIQSMPATKSAGASYTASLVVMDEFAKMLWGAELYGTAKPTIDAGGQLVVMSTAEGYGNFFHTLWLGAQAGTNSFKPVFLPWWARPGRDMAWYRKVLAESPNPKICLQEYPGNSTEAFLNSGRARFEAPWVLAQNDNVRTPLPKSRWPESLNRPSGFPWERGLPTLKDIPGLHVYAPPAGGRLYVISADVAEGKDPSGADDSDLDAAVCFDADTLEEVATLHGRWQPDEYGKFLMALAGPYRAVVIVERNNHGHAVLATFRLKGFPLLHGHRHGPGYGVGHDNHEGWLTHVQTKPQSVDLLAECLRDRLVTIRHRPTLDELIGYMVLKNGSTGAPPRMHDDLVMAWAVGLAYVRDRRTKGGQGGPRVVDNRFKVTNFLGR